MLPQFQLDAEHNISIKQYCQHNTTHIVSTISTILPFRTIFHILLPQYPLYCWHKIYSFADNAQIDPFHNTSFITHLYCQACLAPPYTSATISCHKIIGLPCFTVSLSLMILLPKDLTAKLIITTEMPFLNTPDTLGGNCQNCRQLPDGEEQDASNLSLWSHFIKCLTIARGSGFAMLSKLSLVLKLSWVWVLFFVCFRFVDHDMSIHNDFYQIYKYKDLVKGVLPTRFNNCIAIDVNAVQFLVVVISIILELMVGLTT